MTMKSIGGGEPPKGSPRLSVRSGGQTYIELIVSLHLLGLSTSKPAHPYK